LKNIHISLNKPKLLSENFFDESEEIYPLPRLI